MGVSKVNCSPDLMVRCKSSASYEAKSLIHSICQF
ncbi:hypothetical protein A2U01_0091652, partial [Trifolium medium]|nr:hypothetical protein [Trifolium medium]